MPRGLTRTPQRVERELTPQYPALMVRKLFVIAIRTGQVTLASFLTAGAFALIHGRQAWNRADSWCHRVRRLAGT